MYEIGDVPLILQGAAQREQLPMTLPDLVSTPGFPWAVAGAVALLVWTLGQGGRRNVW